MRKFANDCIRKLIIHTKYQQARSHCSRVAQWKRAGPITQDRNLALLKYFLRDLRFVLSQVQAIDKCIFAIKYIHKP